MPAGDHYLKLRLRFAEINFLYVFAISVQLFTLGNS